MRCPRCRAQLKPGSIYCHKCLQEIHWVPEYNTVETLMEKELRRKMQKDQEKSISHLKKYKLRGLIALAMTAVFICIFLCVNNSYLVQYSLARRAYEHGQYSRALEYVDKALIISPDKGKAVILLSQILNEQGDLLGAIKVLEGSLRDHKDSSEYYRQLIALYEEAGKQDKIKRLILGADFSGVREDLADYLCPDPEISLNTGVYDEEQRVFVEKKEGIRYYYTLDGSQPTKDSPLYQQPIFVGGGVTELYVMGENSYGITSDVLYRKYTVILEVPEAPEILPESGSYDRDANITVEVPDGFKAYYAFDEYPTEDSTEYTAPVKMPTGEHTFYAVLVGVNDEVSDVASQSYYLYY